MQRSQSEGKQEVSEHTAQEAPMRHLSEYTLKAAAHTGLGMLMLAGQQKEVGKSLLDGLDFHR